MAESIVADITPVLRQMQELLATLEKCCHTPRPRKTKSGSVLPKIAKPKHPYSAGNVVNSSFSMPTDLLVQLNSFAERQGKSRSQVIVETLLREGIITVQREQNIDTNITV